MRKQIEVRGGMIYVTARQETADMPAAVHVGAEYTYVLGWDPKAAPDERESYAVALEELTPADARALAVALLRAAEEIDPAPATRPAVSTARSRSRHHKTYREREEKTATNEHLRDAHGTDIMSM